MPEDLRGFVLQQLKRLEEKDRDVIDQVSKYPKSYDRYTELPLEQRLSVATDIVEAFVPKYTQEDMMPDRPFTFDITGLAISNDIETSRISAQIAFADFNWVREPNSKINRELPGVKIAIKLEGDDGSRAVPFASLVYDQEWKGYSTPSVRHFSVVEENGLQTLIKDPTNPLFIDVAKIIDLGIAGIYTQKLDHLIAKLPT